MTYAKDRTLLASLSFGDKDKSDRRHDLVGKYLAQPEVAKKLLGIVGFSKPKNKTTEWKSHARYEPESRHIYTFSDKVSILCEVEAPITKGAGQYKTFIGFIDGFIRYSWDGNKVTETKQPDGSVKIESDRHGEYISIPFEVKIHQESTGNILRQLKLYDEFRSDGEQRWLLVTAYDVSQADQEMFKQNDIVCVRLGEAFDAFVREQEAKASSVVVI